MLSGSMCRPLALLSAAFVALAVSAPAAARENIEAEPQFTLASWTGRDGLPSGYVVSLGQDAEGFLWVGTTAGVSLFDGQHFTTWPRQGPFPSPNPVIYALADAPDGSMWVVFGGPSRIARDLHGVITVYSTEQGLPAGSMRAVLVDHLGVPWTGGTGGVARLTGERWSPLPLTPGEESQPSVTEMVEDSLGWIWVSATQGTYRISPDRRVVEPVTTGLRGPLNLKAAGSAVVLTGDGQIVVLDAGTGRVLSRRSAQTLVTGPFPLAIDRRGRLWAGTNGEGLFLANSVTHLDATRHLTERDGLAGDLIRDILEDRSGNIWIGTQAGLTRTSEATILTRRARIGVSAENVTRLAATADGAVWVQSPDGLVRFSAGNRVVFSKAGALSLRSIAALHTDRAGTLWVATTTGQLLHHDAGVFRPVTWPAGTAPSSIVGIASDSRGHIWLDDGKRLLVHNGQHVTRVPVPVELRTGPVRFLNVDTQDRPWLGTDGRVGVLEKGRFRIYTTAEGVPPGQVSAFYQDQKGRIWLATDSGLSILEGDRFVTFGSANGLPRNRVFSVIEEQGGPFWLGVGSGALRIEPAELDAALAHHAHRFRYRLFDESDGLHGTPVLRGQPNAVRAADGSLWFITSNGLAIIDPARARATQPPPRARIESMTVNGTRLRDLSDPELGPGLSAVQFEYAALNLTTPTKLQFQHQLAGVDGDWVDNAANRQASYANLAPGHYRFRVRASNGDGVWSDEVGAVTFTIRPAWYQTRLMYLVLALAAVGLAWAAVRARDRQLQQRFALVLAERARVGREIHDTLLQSLVGLALQLDTLSDEVQTAPPTTLRGSLVRLRRQVEHYIGEAQQSIWDLRSPSTTHDDFPTSLRERGERITSAAGVALDFSQAGTVRPLPPPLERQLLQIAQEAVVNAVRHAAPRRVQLGVRFDQASLHLSVRDDGHGFDLHVPPESGRRHWGLSIMRERADQVGAHFSIVSEPGRGTQVEVTAPLPETPVAL